MTYHAPEVSALDEVRFLVGDTNTSREIFSDSEIVYALNRKSSPKAAAAFLARQLAGSLPLKFTGYKLADYTDPDGSKMAQAYLSLAARLEAELIAAAGAAGVYAGGISVSDKAAVASNTDRVTPAFSVGMHDNQGSGV